MNKRILQIIFLLSFFSGSLTAGNTDKLCRNIRKAVKEEFQETKLKNMTTFSNSCWFWWQTSKLRDGGFELYVDSWKSEEQSKQKLLESVDFLSEGIGFKTLESATFWDEVFIIEGDLFDSRIVLLRKDKITLKIVGGNVYTVLRFQMAFQKVFDVNRK